MRFSQKQIKVFSRFLIFVVLPICLYNVLTSSYLIRNLMVPLIMKDTGYDMTVSTVDFSLFRKERFRFQDVHLKERHGELDLKINSVSLSIAFFPLRVTDGHFSRSSGYFKDDFGAFSWMDASGSFVDDRQKTDFILDAPTFEYTFPDRKMKSVCFEKCNLQGSFFRSKRVKFVIRDTLAHLHFSNRKFPAIRVSAEGELDENQKGSVAFRLNDGKFADFKWSGSLIGKSQMDIVLKQLPGLKNIQGFQAFLTAQIETSHSSVVCEIKSNVSAERANLGDQQLSAPSVSAALLCHYDFNRSDLTIRKASIKLKKQEQALFSFDLKDTKWQPVRSAEFHLWPLPQICISAEKFPLELLNTTLQGNTVSFKGFIKATPDCFNIESDGEIRHTQQHLSPANFSIKAAYTKDGLTLHKAVLCSLPKGNDYSIQMHGEWLAKNGNLYLESAFSIARPELFFNSKNPKLKEPLKGKFSMSGIYIPENGKLSLSANLDSGMYALAASAQGELSAKIQKLERFEVIFSSAAKRLLTITGQGALNDFRVSFRDISSETLSFTGIHFLDALSIQSLMAKADLACQENEWTFRAEITDLKMLKKKEKMSLKLDGSASVNGAQWNFENVHFEASAENLPLADVTLNGEYYTNGQNNRFKLTSKQLDILAVQNIIMLFPDEQKETETTTQQVKNGPKTHVELELRGLSYTGDLLGNCFGSIDLWNDEISFSDLHLLVNGSDAHLSGKIAESRFILKVIAKNLEVSPIMKLLGYDGCFGKAEILDLLIEGNENNFKYTCYSKGHDLLFYVNSRSKMSQILFLTLQLGNTVAIKLDNLLVFRKYIRPFIDNSADLFKGKKPISFQDVEFRFVFENQRLKVKQADFTGKDFSCHFSESLFDFEKEQLSLNARIKTQTLWLPVIAQGSWDSPKPDMKKTMKSLFKDNLIH